MSAKVYLDVALDHDPWEAETLTWTNVGSIREGVAQLGSRGDDREATGAPTELLIYDPNRTLDPSNTSGGNYSKLYTRREARLRAEIGGTTRQIWRGYVDDLRWDPKTNNTVIPAVDILGLLAELRGLPTPFEKLLESLNPQDWYPMGEGRTGPSGQQAHNRGISNTPGVYSRQPDLGQTGLLPFDHGTAVSFGNAGHATTQPVVSFLQSYATSGAYPGIPLTTLCWVRSEVQPVQAQLLTLTNRPGTIVLFDVVILGDDSGIAAGLVLVRNYDGSTTANVTRSLVRVDDNRPHLIHVTYESGSGGHVHIDGVDQSEFSTLHGATASLAHRWLVAGDQGNENFKPITMQHVAFIGGDVRSSAAALYNAGAGKAAELSNDRISRICDHAGIPGWLRDVGTGKEEVLNQCHDESLLEEANKVAQTEEGLVSSSLAGRLRFRGRQTEPTGINWVLDNLSGIRFTWAESGAPSAHLANIVRLSRETGATQERRDAASVAKFGPRELTIDGLLHTADGPLVHAAARRLAASKDRREIFSEVEINWLVGDAEADAAAQANIGNGVRVVLRPKVGAVTTLEQRIVGITHEISPGGKTITRWRMAPLYGGYVPGCRVYHNVATTVADAVTTALPFGAERYDSDGMHSNVTNNSRITVQTAGEYLFGACVWWATAGTSVTSYQVSLRLNGSTTIASESEDDDTQLSPVVAAWDCDVGDYVEVVVTVNVPSGSVPAIEVVPAVSPEFWAQKLG